MRNLLFASLLLAACGGASQPEPATSASSSEEPATESPGGQAVQPGAPETLACASDADCTLVDAVCPGWQAVNLTSQGAVVETTRNLQALSQCMAPSAPLAPTTVSCDEAACTAHELDHPEWRACASDADCVAVQGVCGGWDAASTSSEAAMRASYAEIAMRVRCAQRTTPTPTPTCRASLCVPR